MVDRKPWTSEELNNLRQYAGQFADKELAILLGKSSNAIRQKAYELSISISTVASHRTQRVFETEKNILPALSLPVAEARKETPLEIPVEARHVPIHRCEIVTPKKAANWLAHRSRNRTIASGVVEQYAEAMLRGDWRKNSETIKISKEGKLLDGQHRCAACVRANADFESWVAYGVEESAFDTIDVGKKRTGGDALSVKGFLNAKNLASALRMIKCYETANASATVSVHETVEMLEKNPLLEASVRIAVNSTNQVLSPGIAGAAHFLFWQKDPEAADRFIEDLGRGIMLEAGDPVMTLRNSLMTERKSKSRLSVMEVMARVIRAWNARRRGQRLTRVAGSVINRTTGEKEWPIVE